MTGPFLLHILACFAHKMPKLGKNDKQCPKTYFPATKLKKLSGMDNFIITILSQFEMEGKLAALRKICETLQEVYCVT